MIDFFIDAYKMLMTQIILEFVAFICGILVLVCKRKNILVYPTGLMQLSLLFIYYIKRAM
jgi:hypothetical protein